MEKGTRWRRGFGEPKEEGYLFMDNQNDLFICWILFPATSEDAG